MTRFHFKDLSAEGKHDFDKPSVIYDKTWMNTFSVGVFPWVLSSNGKFLKKGKAKVRVSGMSEQPQKVYDKALEIALELDAGTYKGPKNVKVK